MFFLFIMTTVPLSILFTNNLKGNEPPPTVSLFIKKFISQGATQIGRSRQLIFATNTDASSFLVTIHVLEKNDAIWTLAFPVFIGTIGEKGFASIHKKKEGDRKSPTGIFPLGTAFGYSLSVATKMPYRQATEDDFWVDDTNSEDYNKWVRGQPKATSMEKMKRGDDLYKYGIVIEYNTSPVVKGKGSAIFLHVWRGEKKPTLGCLAMAEDKILGLLAWLNPASEPLIIMGTEAGLRTMKSRE
jgi:L,D-peptidoglycan transpeptidase YkuD (ErfK/YbiS/YcfS/YnhG family)